MDLYLTRHGESDTERYGGLDPYLTEKGIAQAQLLGSRLSFLHLDAVYASPLIRAVQTAAAVSERQKGAVRVRILPGLYETGTQAGYKFKSRKEIFKYCPNADIPENMPCSQGADSPPECMERAGGIIDFVRSKHGGDEKILLVAHGSFNTYLILSALGFPYKSGFNFSQDNTGLTLIRFLTDADGSPRTKLSYMNDVSHMELNR